MKLYHDIYRLPKKARPSLRESIDKLHIYADEDEKIVAITFWREIGKKPHGNDEMQSEIEYFPISRGTKKLIASAEIIERKLGKIREKLDAYFLGKSMKFEMPMNLQGTAFQKKVWAKLLSVPFGKAISYKDLSRKIDKNMDFFRAVGSAVGKNPICVLIPCHRILPNNSIQRRKKSTRQQNSFEKDEVGKFAGGASIKKELLNFERNVANK